MRKFLSFYSFLISIILINCNIIKRCEECERKKQEQRGDSKTDLFNKIQQIFQLAKSDYFTKNYEMSTLKLIYPSDINMVLQMKRCVLAVKLKGTTTPKMVAIKLEQYSTSRSSTDSQTQKMSCGSNHAEIPADRRLPTEHYLNTLMNTQPHFNRYYPKLSGLIGTKTNEKLMIYVSDFKEGSMDLQAWANKNMGRLSKTDYEDKVKRFYRKIHAALTTLKDNRYIYTDFKPQNVLIDNTEIPYLIDLESVLLDDSSRPCLATRFYSPPKINYEAARSRDQIEDIHNRILSWTFCFSIYETMCFNTKEKGVYESVSGKLSSWQGSSFMTHFGCKNQVSEELKDFINKCLIKNLEKDSFFKLKTLKWLKKKIKIPPASKLQVVSK